MPDEQRGTPGSGTRTSRIAIVASHPTQYQAPLFRALAARPEIDLTVLFCSDFGSRPYYDKGFGVEIRWDLPLLEGYRSKLLPNLSLRPDPCSFWGLVNPTVVKRLREGQFDVIWLHGWGKFTDLLAMATGFATGIPVLLRAETNLLLPLSRPKAILKRFILKRLFSSITAFLAIGHHNAEFYSDYGVPKDKIVLVPYSVDNEFSSRWPDVFRPGRMS